MQLYYRIAADVLVLIHMSYVLIVVIGLPVTWIGILCGHHWGRNFWWRCIHLSMILVVVAEALAGVTCPLTTWEFQLRELGQQDAYQGDFLANLVHDWLFYDVSHAVLTVIYSVFGLLVVISFVVAPPRWPSFRKPSTTTS